MKKNFSYIFALLLLGLFGCREYSQTYNEEAFVAFRLNTASVAEGSPTTPGTFTVEVMRASSDLSQPITVNYTSEARFVSSGNAAPNSFTLSGTPGSITIPSGQARATFVLTTVGNLFQDGSKDVTLTITNSSDASLNIGFPGPSALNSKIVIRITEDDCSFNRNNYLGVFRSFEQGFNPYNVTVQADANNPNAVNIVDFYFFSSFAGFTAVVNAVYTPATGVFEIPDQPLLNTSGTQVSISGSAARIRSVSPGFFRSCAPVESVTRFRIYTSAGIYDENNVSIRP